MASKKGPYGDEFKKQMVELVRAGETPEGLSRRFEPSAQAIRNWVRQADIDEGRAEGLTSDERAELVELRRKVAQMSEEQVILGKALGWFAKRDGSTR